MNFAIEKTLWSVSVLLTTVIISGCERPPVESEQRGYRGLGIVQYSNPRIEAKEAALHQAPDALAAVPAEGPKASSAYKNVQVLGNLSQGEFTRLMVAITNWVSPKEGCAYCHAGSDFAADTMHTKVVARKMLQMTQHINSKWKTHVADTGVTCYTCHRGQAHPPHWHTDSPVKRSMMAFVGADRSGQNIASDLVAYTSLPHDPFTSFLSGDTDIRVAGPTALPTGHRKSIKQAEWTYGLMTHFSQSLGVNCTYCHNAQSFAQWDLSPPQRTTAWHGIRMVRDVNGNFLAPLQTVFPAGSLGPTGDAPKLFCVTCHQGATKPLNGASMLKDYTELGAEVKVEAAPTPTPAADTPSAPSTEGLLGKIYFATAKTAVDVEGNNVIEKIVKALNDNPSLKVAISGFADKTGNANKNLDLAKRRALAVRDALKAAGISEDRLVMQKPEFAIGGAEAEARRVDLSAAN